MCSLSWLHLSDWHEGKPDVDRTIVRQALLEDIRDRSTIDDRLATLDFILFTGDIANTGVKSEYTAFERTFLNPLKDRTANVPLYFVPGNHDANWELLYQFPPILHRS